MQQSRKDVFEKVGNPFVKYKVKIKNSYEYECWITNWPNFMKSIFDEMPDNKNKTKIDFNKLIENKFSNDIGINDFEKEEILKRIKDIEEKWENKYPHFELKTDKVKFDNMVNFNYTFTSEIEFLNLELK